MGSRENHKSFDICSMEDLGFQFHLADDFDAQIELLKNDFLLAEFKLLDQKITENLHSISTHYNTNNTKPKNLKK